MSEIVRNAIEKEGVIAIVRKLYGEPLMKLAEALYAGGQLSEEDEEAFYQHMQRIYARAKQRKASK